MLVMEEFSENLKVAASDRQRHAIHAFAMAETKGMDITYSLPRR